MPTFPDGITYGEDDAIPEFKDLFELLIETPMYKKFRLTQDSENTLHFLRNERVKIDYYCPHCGRDRMFTNIGGLQSQRLSRQQIYAPGDITFLMSCAYDKKHVCRFVIYLAEGYIEKIGQKPSYADLKKSELKQYKNILKGSDYAEMNKAYGLISHDAAIGAFVYLRRVFERVISRTEERARREDQSINVSGQRMVEKIQTLKRWLPNVLYENRAVYSILSKGVHELEEEECSRYYPALNAALLLILEYESHLIEEAKRVEQVKVEIARVANLLERAEPKSEQVQ